YCSLLVVHIFFFFFQAEDGIRDRNVTGVQTCALPIFPIIAALFVPICMTAGFSTLGTAILIGTAGALGDAGSPASDSTLGPTAGLNADGKHHHIWDTCVPTFIHFNIPNMMMFTICI